MDSGLTGKLWPPQMQVRPQINGNGVAAKQVERIGGPQIDIEARIVMVRFPTDQKIRRCREPRLERKRLTIGAVDGVAGF